MSKRKLQYRQKNKKGIGKTMGRSQGPLIYSDKLGRKTSTKIYNAIKNNEEK